MTVLQTPHQRKSFSLTVLLMALLVWVLFFFGLSYWDPPIESGVTIRFGDIALADLSSEASISDEFMEVPEVDSSTAINEELASSEEELLVSDPLSEAPITATPEKKINPAANSIPAQDTPKTTPKPKPRPDAATQAVLNRMLQGANASTNTTATSSTSNGNAQGQGQQGSLTGDPYAPSFYGGGAGVDGIGFGLSGRKLLSKSAVVQNCEQQGRVVVRIVVNQQGKVLSAQPGAQGTTNTDPCLMSPAQKTAMSFVWAADPKAPEQQVGFVVVDFRLGQ
jgi:outer membrane biosynthesis protein TonB